MCHANWISGTRCHCRSATATANWRSTAVVTSMPLTCRNHGWQSGRSHERRCAADRARRRMSGCPTSLCRSVSSRCRAQSCASLRLCVSRQSGARLCAIHVTHYTCACECAIVCHSGTKHCNFDKVRIAALPRVRRVSSIRLCVAAASVNRLSVWSVAVQQLTITL